MRRVARLCTYLLEPKNWLIATLALIGWHAGGRAGLGWGLLAGLFAAVLPTVFISLGIHRGRWSDRNVGARRPRLIVLAFIMASVAAGLILLIAGGAPRLLTGYLAFMLASVAALALVTVVWKISIHCAVAAGSVAILAFAYGPPVLAASALVALLGWARVALGDHTAAQVAAGAALGAGAAALAYAVLAPLTSLARLGSGRQQESTTASGHAACAIPVTRSASPTCPDAVTSSAKNQTSKASRTATAVAATGGRRPHGTAGPRRHAPAGQAVSAASPTEDQRMCCTG